MRVAVPLAFVIGASILISGHAKEKVTKSRAPKIHLDYSDATIVVSSSRHARADKSKDASQMLTVSYPKTISKTIKASAGEHVHIAFGISSTDASFTPSQILLRLTHQQTKKSSYYPAVKSNDNYRVSLDVSNRGQLGAAAIGGTFEAVLIIGDSNVENPVQWKLCDVTLRPPQAPNAPDLPLYTKPLLHESDTTFTPLQEIIHQFRPAEAEAPLAISLLFSALMFVPWVGFFVFFFKSSPQMTTQRIPIISATVFHGALLTILVVYAAYWMGWYNLNMFSTLSVVAVVSVPLCFSGNRLLRALRTDVKLKAA